MSKSNNWRIELGNLLTLASKDPDLLDKLLDDLLTPEELKNIALRWHIIKQLYQNIPQRDIAQSLGVGIATVTRGSRMLKNPKGGFHRIINMIISTNKPTGLTKVWRNQLMK